MMNYNGEKYVFFYDTSSEITLNFYYYVLNYIIFIITLRRSHGLRTSGILMHLNNVSIQNWCLWRIYIWIIILSHFCFFLLYNSFYKKRANIHKIMIELKLKITKIKIIYRVVIICELNAMKLSKYMFK